MANSDMLGAGAGALVNGSTFAAVVSSTSSADSSITGLHLVGGNLSTGGSLQLVVAVSGSVSQQATNYYGITGSTSGSISFSIQGSANAGSAQTLISNTVPYIFQAPAFVGTGNYSASYGPTLLTSSFFSFAPGDTDAFNLSLSAKASTNDSEGAFTFIDDTLELVSISYVDASGNPILGDSLVDDSGDIFALNQPLIASPEPGTLAFFGFGLMVIGMRIGFVARKLSLRPKAWSRSAGLGRSLCRQERETPLSDSVWRSLLDERHTI